MDRAAFDDRVFASPELAACYDLPLKQIGILPPIPEGAAAASEPAAAAESGANRLC